MKTKNVSLLLIALLVLVYGSVSALGYGVVDINLLLPTNNSYNINGTLIFYYNMSSNSSSNNVCALWSNVTGSFASTETDTTVANVTVSNFTITDAPNGHIGWTVGCTAPGNSTVSYPANISSIKATTGSPQINYTIRVDKNAPVITINSPSRAGWQKNGSGVQFNITAQDVNNETCVLQSNLNVTSNTTGAFVFDKELKGYGNGTPINFSFGYNVGNFPIWADNNNGAYLWNVVCNDSAGNFALLSSGNSTFFVDTVAPNRPALAKPINFSLSTDLTPTFTWGNVSDLNFSLYEVQLANASSFAAGNILWHVNISGNNSNNDTVLGPEGTFLGNLTYDQTVFWRINAYDLAGNLNTSSPYFHYRTDSTCGVLVGGRWNVCAITNNVSINASALCAQTGCDFISMYNASHGFQTHTRDSSTNDEMYFVADQNHNSSSVVFIYLSSNVTWENRTNDIEVPGFYVNLSNISGGWNIVPILNLTGVWTFSALDNSTNWNGSQVLNNNSYPHQVKFMSIYRAENVSTSRFTSFATNKSFNKNLQLEYGLAVWMQWNISNHSAIWNSSARG